MKTKLYVVKRFFAKKKETPISFVATAIRETEKAIYLYGHGARHPEGRCLRCGRALTHPGSIVIGIGPECLGSYGARKERLENMTDSDKAYLESLITDQKVDTWFPKSQIKQVYDSEEQINVPSNHKMLKPAKTKQERKAIKEGDTIRITFPYNRDDLEFVRGLDGRKFDMERKFWTCPISYDSIRALKNAGFAISDELNRMINTTNTKMGINDEARITNIKEIEVPGLNGELFPFQKKGVSFIEETKGRALIGDEMGLGKTVQALAWLQLHPEKRPAVIVCPASLKLNWEQEANTWLQKPNVQVLNGNDHTVPLIGDIIIINYDILPNMYENYFDKLGKKRKREIKRTGWVDFILDINPQVVILDESHYIKNNSAIRTKGTKKLAKKTNHIIALSGTPIKNKPIEIFNTIQIVDKAVAPNFWSYAHEYCGATHNGFGWDFNGATNTEELHRKLVSTIMLRRTKNEVLKDLPDKIRSFIPISVNNRNEYEKAEDKFIEYIKDIKGSAEAEKASNAVHLAQMETLKQLAVEGKMKQCIEWISNFLDNGKKLVVFATHKKTIDHIMNAFKNQVVKIDGSVSGKERNDAVNTFQNDDKIKLFVGNIQAAGVGLTLTASSNVAFVELPWAPADVTQAEDRVHRIGQKDAVNIYYLLAKGTIEEEIASLLDKKRKVLDAVLDGKKTEKESLLTELLNKYIQRS